MLHAYVFVFDVTENLENFSVLGGTKQALKAKHKTAYICDPRQ